MKNIMLALNVESFDEGLLKHAVGMCNHYAAKLWLVHVAPYPSSFKNMDDSPGALRESVADELRMERRLLQKLADQIRGGGAEVTAKLLRGEIVKVLLEEADKLDADLIICGKHRHGFLANALGGNISLEIIKKSRHPVLCIPLSASSTKEAERPKGKD